MSGCLHFICPPDLGAKPVSVGQNGGKVGQEAEHRRRLDRRHGHSNEPNQCLFGKIVSECNERIKRSNEWIPAPTSDGKEAPADFAAKE